LTIEDGKRFAPTQRPQRHSGKAESSLHHTSGFRLSPE
jgi:hypothetical protein